MESSAPDVALVLVRNTVSHDARVLRSASTLQDLGFAVLIIGVVSTDERQAQLALAGIRILRLDPGAKIRRIARLRRRRAQTGQGAALRSDVGTPPNPGSGPDRPGPGLPGLPARLAQRTKRIAVTGSFYMQGARLVWRTSPAVVHANDYNTMWIGIAAKLLRGSRLIYDSHELWPDRNGRPEWRLWLLACEALFVRLADATITASPGYGAAIAARYRVSAPQVIRNIPVTAQPPGPAAQPPARGLAVYLGGLMPGRGLEQAIDALTLAPQLSLRLIGPGRDAYRAALQRRIDAAGLSHRAEIWPAVAPADILTVIADADMGLMLIQPVCRSYQLTLPNKLFEYAAAGLPILSSDLTVIGPLVASEGLGEVVGAADIEQIAQGMVRLADPEVNAERRERVRSFARRVTWEQERVILADVYRRVAGHERDGDHRAGGGPPAGDGPQADGEAERRRVTRVYEGYGASPRKRRSWSAENPGNAAIRAELVAAAFAQGGAELAAARDLLDVGCGSGWWLECLDADPRIGAGLHGLDLLPARAAAARARVPTATIAIGDARQLPFEAGRFDVVTMFTVLSSLPSGGAVEAALGEARRVLRPGGIVIVWEPRLPTPFNRHTVRVTERRLGRALAGTRIQARTITVSPPLARRLGRFTDYLYPQLARLPALRTHRLICARVSRPPR